MNYEQAQEIIYLLREIRNELKHPVQQVQEFYPYQHQNFPMPQPGFYCESLPSAGGTTQYTNGTNENFNLNDFLAKAEKFIS